MIKNINKKAGFTLIELVVVTGIVGVMSVAGIIGFKSMQETIVDQQSVKVVQDLIDRTKLEVLQGESEGSKLYVDQGEYMIVETVPSGAVLGLSFDPTTNELSITSDAKLYKKDKDGNVLSLETVVDGYEFEVTDFDESDETEWHYQLVSGSDYSPVVKFVHFNVNRENPKTTTISAVTDLSYVEYLPPYNNPAFYKENDTEMTNIPEDKQGIWVDTGEDEEAGDEGSGGGGGAGGEGPVSFPPPSYASPQVPL